MILYKDMVNLCEEILKFLPSFRLFGDINNPKWKHEEERIEVVLFNEIMSGGKLFTNDVEKYVVKPLHGWLHCSSLLLYQFG